MADTINIMSMNNEDLKNHLTELGIKVKDDEKRSAMIKMYGEWKKKHAEKEEENVEQEVQKEEKAEKKVKSGKKSYKVATPIRRNGVDYAKGDEIEAYDGIEEELGHALEL